MVMRAQHLAAPAELQTGPQNPTTYLFLSDVHLGSDIVPHVRPWARHAWLRDTPEVDARLVSLLNHYRRETPQRERVCLVIAGDFLDLVGVSLAVDKSLVRTAPTREERIHGLGSAADHVVLKVRAIAERHAEVFRALAAFLGAGHSLVVVRGNHDVELHWRSAQCAFVEAVAAHVDATMRANVRARIRICPWYFSVRGLFYVEHGHEFDPMCSFGDPLLPVCARDTRRIRAVPFSLMLRQVARPTRGLSSASYEDVSLATYLCLLGKLGLWGTARIAVRFGRAVRGLLREWFHYTFWETPRRVLRARRLHARFAAREGLDAPTLERLRSLYTKPAARSLRVVLKSLYLDRVFAVLLAFLLMGVAAWVVRTESLQPGIVMALFGLALGGYGVVGSGRDISATAPMRRSAQHLAALFDAKYVIMGHTHQPEVTRVSPGITYVNLGHWGEDDVPEERASTAASAPCTFFCLRVDDSGHRAELLAWDEHLGPRAYAPRPTLVPAPRATAVAERA
jgi:UDP-2,3-diacylglucosamine pyrophosphatase LpxH